MRILILIVALLIQGLYQLKAQDPHFSQFYANPLYLNPAMAGTNGCHRIVSNYRNQWPSISGSYVTYNISYDGHYDEIAGGIGAHLLHDRAGVGELTSTQLSLMYSYHLTVSSNFAIKAGLQYMGMSKEIDFAKLTWFDQIEPRLGFVGATNEPLPEQGLYKTGIIHDFSAGILAFSSKFYVGFAVHHINTPNVTFYGNDDSYLPRKYTGNIGMMIPMDNEREPRHYFSPNVLVMHQHNFMQLFTGFYYIKDFFIAGVWFRQTSVNTDGFQFLIGLKKDPVKIGYSFDLTTSDIRIGSIGSHEISMIFEFCTYKRPPSSKWRKLICPTF